MNSLVAGCPPEQCFRFSRNTSQGTPKIIHFNYQKNLFVGSKYPEKMILKTKALLPKGVLGLRSMYVS